MIHKVDGALSTFGARVAAGALLPEDAWCMFVVPGVWWHPLLSEECEKMVVTAADAIAAIIPRLHSGANEMRVTHLADWVACVYRVSLLRRFIAKAPWAVDTALGPDVLASFHKRSTRVVEAPATYLIDARALVPISDSPLLVYVCWGMRLESLQNGQIDEARMAGVEMAQVAWSRSTNGASKGPIPECDFSWLSQAGLHEIVISAIFHGFFQESMRIYGVLTDWSLTQKRPPSPHA